MAGNCFIGCSRIFFSLISLLNVILGVAIIAAIVWMRTGHVDDELRSLLLDNTSTPSEMYELKQYVQFTGVYIFWLAIIYGTGLFLIGFVGACGAYRVSRTANGVYVTLLVLFFFGEMVLLLIVAFHHDKASELIARYLNIGAKFNLHDMQVIRERFNCCGDDTSNSYNIVCQNGSQPNCTAIIGSLLIDTLKTGGTLLLALMAFQFATLLFSCVLFANHKYRTLQDTTASSD